MNKWYIYRTTCLINGKTYIGQHKYRKLNDSYLGSGTAIRNAIKKYGKDNFKKEILYSDIYRQDTADSVEQFAIWKERQLGKAEYNLGKGREHSWDYETIEQKHTEMSLLAVERNKGRKWFTNGKEEAFTFNAPSSDWKEGRAPFTKLTKDNMSKSQSGENNSFYGCHHSEELIERWRHIRKGNYQCKDAIRRQELFKETSIRSSNSHWYWNPETLEESFSVEDLTIKGWNKGRLPHKHWSETRKSGYKGKDPWNKGKHTGQIPWNKGKTLSDETKQKISEAKRKEWNKIK